MDFLTDFINVFDSIIVISSYVLLIMDLRIAIVGLLRVLRLSFAKSKPTLFFFAELP